VIRLEEELEIPHALRQSLRQYELLKERGMLGLHKLETATDSSSRLPYALVWNSSLTSQHAHASSQITEQRVRILGHIHAFYTAINPC